ncbi:MAG: LysR family transcriptional regulator [Polynucleobacter sp.]|jgi:DNA-binding transcriptional LysR family regulator|nr:LysR family transcriptional regulator [Polynucleobacter sp.]
MDRVQGISLFIRVVETGSFSKAAASLGITQPTATKHVAALEKHLGSLLLHRSTRGVTPTEIGKLYYDKCKNIAQELEDADNLAGLLQTEVKGKLSISSSVAFGRRVLTPLMIQFMGDHPQIQVSLSLDDRYVNLVEQGVDIAIRMGRLPDSTLGSRYLGLNPWVLVATPEYLKKYGTPSIPSDLSKHKALIYSSVQGDHRWHFTGRDGDTKSIQVNGPLQSNNLSTLLAATLSHLGLAALPWYVAQHSISNRNLKPLLQDWNLPSQEIHAVFSSPRLVPSKVSNLIDWLQGQFSGNWWANQIGS